MLFFNTIFIQPNHFSSHSRTVKIKNPYDSSDEYDNDANLNERKDENNNEDDWDTRFHYIKLYRVI